MRQSMHRYSVRYIERDGAIDERHVLAKNKAEARRIAEAEGCEDILKVRHDGFSLVPVLVVLLVVAALVATAYFVR